MIKKKNISQEDLEAAKTVLENRVNGLGVAEPIVQTLGKDKIDFSEVLRVSKKIIS